MSQEAHLRQNALRKGEWTDEAIGEAGLGDAARRYAVLAEQWRHGTSTSK